VELLLLLIVTLENMIVDQVIFIKSCLKHMRKTFENTGL